VSPRTCKSPLNCIHRLCSALCKDRLLLLSSPPPQNSHLHVPCFPPRAPIASRRAALWCTIFARSASNPCSTCTRTRRTSLNSKDSPVLARPNSRLVIAGGAPPRRPSPPGLASLLTAFSTPFDRKYSIVTLQVAMSRSRAWWLKQPGPALGPFSRRSTTKCSPRGAQRRHEKGHSTSRTTGCPPHSQRNVQVARACQRHAATRAVCRWDPPRIPG
jgi:hypothetical protein